MCFVQIEEQAEQSASLLIENNLKGVDFIVYQTCKEPTDSIKVPSKQVKGFSWQEPLKEKEVYIQMVESERLKVPTEPAKFSFDELQKNVKTPFTLGQDLNREVLATTTIKGNSILLTIFSKKKDDLHQSREFKSEKEGKEKIKFSLKVELNAMGLSIISENMKHEVAFVYINSTLR